MPQNPESRRRTSAWRQTRARQLRQEQTSGEAILWEQLRSRRFGGWKFRRQHPIGRFIVDFCCAEHRLVVEVDGAVHDEAERRSYDQERTATLQSAGYRLIRVTNEQVHRDLQAVLQALRAALAE